MPTYLVESYAASSEAALNDARDRARRTAELGFGVRYPQTIFLPGDETILHLFEAPSVEALDEAGRLAALPFERIVEAVEGPPSRERRRDETERSDHGCRGSARGDRVSPAGSPGRRSAGKAASTPPAC